MTMKNLIIALFGKFQIVKKFVSRQCGIFMRRHDKMVLRKAFYMGCRKATIRSCRFYMLPLVSSDEDECGDKFSAFRAHRKNEMRKGKKKRRLNA